MRSRSRVWARCLLGLCAFQLMGARAAPGQREVIRVVVVQGAATGASRDLLDGFRRRLEQLGRRVDLVVETEDEAGSSKSAAEPARLVVALGSRATTLAATSHHGVPIISALVTRENPLRDNTAAAVVLEFAPEVELEWMHRILPNAKRIGVLYSSDDNGDRVGHARDAARALGMVIVARRVTGASEIPAALAALAGSADVLWGMADDVVLTPETARAMLLASLRSRVPFVGLSPPWVRAGAVYALDRDYADLGVQTADLAIRLLDGAVVRSVAVVRPRKVRYSLNARTADVMGLTFPGDLLHGATEVIR